MVNKQALPMLTVREVSQRLGVSRAFVYQAAASGMLEHYKLGKVKGRIRISEDQFSKYLIRFYNKKRSVIFPEAKTETPMGAVSMSRELSKLLGSSKKKVG